MRRRFIIVLLLLSIVPLSGCTIPIINKTICLPSWIPLIGGKCDGSSLEEITLTYWGLWEEAAVIQPLIDKYQSLNPGVTIEYQKRDISDYFETMRARISTDLSPEIIRVHNTWVPVLKEYLSSLPSEVMDNTTYQQTFYPVTDDTLLLDGKYYGIPLGIDGLALLYNRSLFSQAGISSPPKTWDEFKIISKELTETDEKGRIIQAGAALGYGDGIEHAVDIIGLIMAQNGVSFADEAGKVSFHKSFSEEGNNLGEDALSFYKLFATSRKSWNPDWDSALNAFVQGKLAMMFAPSYRLLDIWARNPGLSVGVTQVPQLSEEEGEDQWNWATFWVEVVPKKGQYRDEAWKFLHFLSQKESLTEMYRLAENQRQFGKPYPRQDMAAELINHQYLGPYISQARTYRSWNLTDFTFDEQLNDEIRDVFVEKVEAIAKGQDVAQLLTEAAERVQKILDSFKK
ncbi:extracellular solute-binding protein [Patescibacteria group bacterium]|nr:extracellular solute-binding protein [Patescibacteria group bacterium]MBU1868738.1 extracellular solute-binding protein [Patescibacteria group bacterium]